MKNSAIPGRGRRASRLVENGMAALPAKVINQHTHGELTKITATVATAVPMRCTATTMITMYGTPNIAPKLPFRHVQQGDCLFWFKEKNQQGGDQRANGNVRNALLNTPTRLPSCPLIAA